MPPPVTAPALDSTLLATICDVARRQIQIKRIATTSGSAKGLSVDEVHLGETRIDKVTIENLSTEVNCGAAILRNVRAILELHFKVRWSYDLKWFGSDRGVKDLGSKAKPIPLHDIEIPMLQDIALDVPAAEVSDVEAEVMPIRKLDLGGGTFEDLHIDDTTLPTDGFSMTGMGVGSVSVEDFGAPASQSAQLTIEKFEPKNPLTLPDIKVRGIRVPTTTIPDATSDGAVSVMDISPEDFEAPVFKIGDLFKAAFIARPVLHLQIGELVLSNLQASAEIASLGVSGVSAEATVRGIKLSDLALRDLLASNIKI